MFFLALQDSVLPQSLDPVGVKIPTVKILMREIFNSPAEELYRIFTTKEVSDTFYRPCNLVYLNSCVSNRYVVFTSSGIGNASGVY